MKNLGLPWGARLFFLIIVILMTGRPAVEMAHGAARGVGPVAQIRDSAQILAAANSAYENGDFAAAAAGYQQLLRTGTADAAVHYNLGNTWYRLGAIGRAILAYERARLLDPSDAQIRENLEFVSSQITDRVEEGVLEVGPLATLWEWHGRLPPAVATVAFLLAWLLFNGCLATAVLATSDRLRRIGAYALAASLLAVLVTGAVLGLLTYRRDAVIRGIVLEAKVDLQSVPGGGLKLTTVHEGLKLRVRAARGDWLEVALPNGFRGWVPRNAVGIV